MTLATTTTSLADRLKADTRELHRAAERHPLQRNLVSGSITPAGYAEYLAQMVWVHGALEAGLRGAVAEVPAVGALLRGHHFRLPQLNADLADLGIHAPLPAPTPATAQFCDWLGQSAAANPADLIGVLYVLEGSTNGGRYIARGLSRVLRPPHATATRYLDPHGDKMAERWGEFRASLDQLELGAAIEARIIDAARMTFRSLVSIFDDLVRKSAPAAVSATAI